MKRLALTFLALALVRPAAASQARKLAVDGRERTYRLHVPASVHRPAALVLVFHGGGGQAAGMERLSRFDELADREGFLVVYPDGLGRHWNDGREENRKATRGADDVRFVSALLDALEKEFPVDPKSVFATGMSNGAIFCNHLAMRIPERLAAIAPVAGGITPSDRAHEPAARPVSVLAVNGTEDPLMPYGGGSVARGRGLIVPTEEAIAFWKRSDGLDGTPVKGELPDADARDGCRVKTYTRSGGKEGSAVVLYRIEGGGHTWPGGAAYLPRPVIGRVCRDFDATRVIWDFFEAHPRR